MLILFLACTSGKPGDGDDTATTEALDPLPVNRACLMPYGDLPEDHLGISYAIEAAGIVIDAGTGDPPGGCRDRLEWTGGEVLDWTGTETQWVRIRIADDTEWVAAMTNPMAPDALLLLDQDVLVSYRSVLASPMEGRAGAMTLTLDTAEVSMWAGTAGGVDEFDAWSEVTLAPGDVEADFEDDCGTHRRRALQATVAGTTEMIATGATAGFDGLGVWSGGVVEDVELSCSEYDGSYASAVMWTVTGSGV